MLLQLAINNSVIVEYEDAFKLGVVMVKMFGITRRSTIGSFQISQY